MINDIKDLSTIEREKMLRRKHFWSYFVKCIGGVVVATFAISVFAIFKLGNINIAFAPERAIFTSGRIVSTFMLLLFLMMGVYFVKPKGDKGEKCVRDFWLIIIVVVITFMVSISSSDELNRYAMPIAIASLVVLELLNVRMSMITIATMSMIVIISFFFSIGASSHEYYMGRIFSATMCNALSAVVISCFARKHYSRLKFLLASLIAPLAIVPFVLMTTLATMNAGEETMIYLLWNVLYFYGGNAVAALVFMPLVAIFEGIFNIADDFRLSELCNLSNPLLKRLASEAPGTFNHSLVVGNLSEACASAIGENPNLARCAAYYHDIGKLKAPLYFSENQSSYNPHDELIPEVSVSMIISHTLFGEILAKQSRLPSEIVDICRQHHGTAPVGYFYRKALTLKEDGDLAVDKYTYAGPKPQTKMAAIIMIADTVEAAIRAYMPDTREEYEARINMLIEEKINLRQFDECPITFGDIAIIKKTITESLASIHHGRVEYNKNLRGRARK